MTVLLVLPPCAVIPDDLQRAVNTVRGMAGHDTLHIAASQEAVETYRQALPDQPVRPYELTDTTPYGVLIFLEGRPAGEMTYLPEEEGLVAPVGKDRQRFYRMNRWGRLSLLNQELDTQEYPFLNAHVFNRLSSRLSEGFLYFPHGYLYRYPGMGPIDELGYRTSQAVYELASRPRHHKLVAVFGGSAAFSLLCRHEDMFTTKLEKKLNEYCAKTSTSILFSVFNFGVPGHVVLNEMTTFLSFGHAVKPEIVIGHDGYNDFYYGQVSDPYLLNKYALTYQNIHEKWSQIIFDSQDIALTWPEDKEPWWENKSTTLNYPRSIVAAYSARQQQFQQVVHSTGAIFIGALQPSLFCRVRKSSEELTTLQYQLDGMYGVIHKGMPFLYEKYFQHGSYRGLQHFLNFPQYFGEQLDDSLTLFGDCVHTTPDGDEAISEIYCRYICTELLPRLVG